MEHGRSFVCWFIGIEVVLSVGIDVNTIVTCLCAELLTDGGDIDCVVDDRFSDDIVRISVCFLVSVNTSIDTNIVE